MIAKQDPMQLERDFSRENQSCRARPYSYFEVIQRQRG